jgi:hypothetical protein
MAAEQPAPGNRHAVWVVHGMGQQIPFQTLEDVATGVIGAAERSAEVHSVDDPTFRSVRVGTQVLQRVELRINLKDRDTPLDVDLYECYWAPKTEGVVALKDVIGFLWDGGTRGLVNCFQKFQRAMFGQMAGFSLSWRTPAYLIVTLAVLAALMVINAIIVGASVSVAGIGRAQNLLPMQRIQPLTAVAGIVCAVVITFGTTLFLAEMSRNTRPELKYGSLRKFSTGLSWASLWLTAFVIIVGGVLMALMVWPGWIPAWMTPEFQKNLPALANVLIFLSVLVVIAARITRRIQVSCDAARGEGWALPLLFDVEFLLHGLVIAGVLWLIFDGGNFPAWTRHLWQPAHALRNSAIVGGAGSGVQRLIGPAAWQRLAQSRGLFSFYWVWPFLFLISAMVRKLLVQYVGDVAAYVASNKVDRFDELRQKLKTLAHDSAAAVYMAKAPASNAFEYEKVAIVGHSLGSVIAYDTLNRLLDDDSLAGGTPAVAKVGVLQRTSVFLTFGSPLDKTAFFFSILGKNTRHIREQLAAVVQPLIENEACRQAIRWINIYSRNDIISGRLTFYDLPAGTPPPLPAIRPVENVEDPEATIPLTAHVEYWGNRIVWDRLLAEIIR